MLQGTNNELRLHPAAEATYTRAEAAQGQRHYAHILLPLSLAPQNFDALKLAIQLADASHARLTLLRMLRQTGGASPQPGLDAIGQLHSSAFSAAATQSAESLEADRKDVLKQLAHEIPVHLHPSIHVQTEWHTGDVAKEIARYANHAGADLVILPSELSTWGAPILPSQVRRVLRMTRAPVVLVRPGTSQKPVVDNAVGSLIHP